MVEEISRQNHPQTTRQTAEYLNINTTKHNLTVLLILMWVLSLLFLYVEKCLDKNRFPFPNVLAKEKRVDQSLIYLRQGDLDYARKSPRYDVER